MIAPRTRCHDLFSHSNLSLGLVIFLDFSFLLMLCHISYVRHFRSVDHGPKAPLKRLLSKFLRTRRVRANDFHFVKVREAKTGSAAIF